MNKITTYLILLIFCRSEFQIVCSTLCKSDGDEASFTNKGVCYCANRRDINKFILKIPRNMEINTLKEPSNQYGE